MRVFKKLAFKGKMGHIWGPKIVMIKAWMMGGSYSASLSMVVFLGFLKMDRGSMWRKKEPADN